VTAKSFLPYFHFYGLIDFRLTYKCKVHGLNPFNKREIKAEVERLQGRFNELLTANSTKVTRMTFFSSGSIRKKNQTKTNGKTGKEVTKIQAKASLVSLRKASDSLNRETEKLKFVEWIHGWF